MKRVFAGLLAAGAVAAAAGAPVAQAVDAPPRAERVLELASPLQSEGFNVKGWGWPDGAHSLYKLGIFDLNGRYGTRGAAGMWSFTTLPQFQPQVISVFQDGADDFSRQVVYEQQMFAREGAPESLAVHDADGRSQEIAAWQLPDPATPVERGIRYEGRSADATTLYLRATPGIFPEPSASGLYRWEDGAVDPIVLDDGRPAECKGGASIGSQSTDAYTSLLQNGVSADGRTIFVTTAGCVDAGGADLRPRVLVWRDGATADPTAPIDGADHGADYLGNTRDGSTLYFRTRNRLQADDVNGAPDLFAYDVEGGELTRITADDGADDATAEGAVVSPGGERIWFATARPLAGQGAAGRGNFFTWSAESGVRYLLGTELLTQLGLSAGPMSGASEASFDGSHYVMATAARLTPDGTGSAAKLYRIGADGSVVCISCRADGRPNNNGSRLTTPPTTDNAAWGTPSVSADGSTIVFETDHALDPADNNGRGDVYLWRDGERTLVSTGTQPADSRSGGMSWDGGTVFFSSFGALLPGTRDGFEKLYAARIGASRPAGPLEPCAGDACQGPSTPLPPLATASSERFHGPGDLEERPATVRSLAPRWPGRAALRKAARNGRFTLVVAGSGAGRVSASAQARMRGAWVQVATGARTQSGSGAVRMPLRLSRQARRQLARGGSLRLRLTVTASRVAGSHTKTFLLRGAQKRVVRR